jgi:hypothetical protein
MVTLTLSPAWVMAGNVVTPDVLSAALRVDPGQVSVAPNSTAISPTSPTVVVSLSPGPSGLGLSNAEVQGRLLAAAPWVDTVGTTRVPSECSGIHTACRPLFVCVGGAGGYPGTLPRETHGMWRGDVGVLRYTKQ